MQMIEAVIKPHKLDADSIDVIDGAGAKHTVRLGFTRDTTTSTDPTFDVKWNVTAFEGAAQDTEFLLQVGLRIANSDKWPEWKPGNEFKAVRDEMMKK